MIEKLLTIYERYAEQLPLEVFVLVGSFVEEVVAPIPSPFVMTLAGSVAAAQNYPFWYLFVVSVLAAAGKTLGAVILYWLADKSEDLVLSKFGRFVGVTHKDVERIGQRFSGGGQRDWIVLMIIRSTPIIASAPVSLICGVLKVRFRIFIITTFLGSIIRDFVYLYVGFTTLDTANSLTENLSGVESLIQWSMLLTALGVLGWIIYKKRIDDKD